MNRLYKTKHSFYSNSFLCVTIQNMFTGFFISAYSAIKEFRPRAKISVILDEIKKVNFPSREKISKMRLKRTKWGSYEVSRSWREPKWSPLVHTLPILWSTNWKECRSIESQNSDPLPPPPPTRPSQTEGRDHHNRVISRKKYYRASSN